MVFVHPAAQRTGVGLPLLLHVLKVAAALDYQRVGVWTADGNTPARKLYERAGMTLTGKSAPFRSGTQLQYECPLSGELGVPGLKSPHRQTPDSDLGLTSRGRAECARQRRE